MKPANPKLLTGRHALMLALLVAPFAAVDRAEAGCVPQSPINGEIVTCSDATSDQNGRNGYGR